MQNEKESFPIDVGMVNLANFLEIVDSAWFTPNENIEKLAATVGMFALILVNDPIVLTSILLRTLKQTVEGCKQANPHWFK